MGATKGRQKSQEIDQGIPEHGHRMAKSVFAHYDFLRRLTEKRFPDGVLADEAYSYAFERLAQDNWLRVRAYQGKSSLRGYLGCVWSRLLEDFAIKKFGKITPPQWIKNLGSVWEELFRLLCRRRLTIQDAVEKILADERYAWDAPALEKAAAEILAGIPNCGRKVGPAFSMDDDRDGALAHPCLQDPGPIPDELAISKEKWMALQAMVKVFFTPSNDNSANFPDEENLVALVHAIRERLSLDEEERLILTAHFVDGESITTVGKRLKRNQNQIHGQFRRLKEKIRTALSDLLEIYL
jgi:RNA polymerase sigma factor (sigma-70 family)